MIKLDSSTKHRSFRLTPDSTPLDIGSVGSLREVFYFAIAQQLFLLVISAPLLDGGVVFRGVTVAIIAFWCFAAMFFVRRRNKPTNVDLLFIKYGIWLLLAIVKATAGLLGRT